MKLERILNELFIIDKEILKEEIEGFIIAIKNEVSIEEASNIFLEAYEVETEEEKVILKGELEKLALGIRKWTLKGRKINEIEGKNKTVISSKNVGRNDKCPCGSNKKYKNVVEGKMKNYVFKLCFIILGATRSSLGFDNVFRKR